MDLALILQLLELLGRLIGENGRKVHRVYLLQAGVQTESALLQSPNLLKAQGHIVHGHLDQESVLGVLLEFKSVEERLGLLEQGKRPVTLVLRNEVNRRVVELMKDHGQLILIQVELFTVEALKGVFSGPGGRLLGRFGPINGVIRVS